MLCFYIDETLTSEEEFLVLDAFAENGNKLDRIEYRRIPCVFPAGGDVTNDKMLDVLKSHIRNARVPVGSQSIFIVPKDGIRWAVLLQEALYLVTGFYPFVIQPWQSSASDGDDSIKRRDYLHMIDMHGVMAG